MNIHRKTKIVATIGPASEKPEVLRRLIEEGINVARLNFSHGDHAEHAKRIRLIRHFEKETGRLVAIIGDLQGPKMRVGKLPEGGVVFEAGKLVVFDTSKTKYENGCIPLPSPVFRAGTKKGARVFLDDGGLAVEIVKVSGSKFTGQVHRGGVLFSNKGVNVPLLELRRNILERKDREDLAFAKHEGVDYVALSFIRNANDVRIARRLLGASSIKLIAKIERPEALENLEEIIEAADGVMVARGDLGIETPLWEVPIRQKDIIRRAREQGKPVIVATQMLESMMQNASPTRAEVSDVANAVYDLADAVMLSGESASGKHPIEAVRMMRRIVEATEKHVPETDVEEPKPVSATRALAKSARYISADIGAKAIIAGTVTGGSALAVSRHRPRVAVIGAAANERAARQLALVWGVYPMLVQNVRHVEQIADRAVQRLKKNKDVRAGDKVVFLSGRRPGEAGQASTISIIDIS